MYLIEIKLRNNKIYRIKVRDSKALGKLIQDNMKTCHYIKILEEHIERDGTMYEVEVKENDKTYHEQIEDLKKLKELLLKYPEYTSFEAKNTEKRDINDKARK